jgi:homoserine dehydrogenase
MATSRNTSRPQPVKSLKPASSHSKATRPVKVALLGFGTVGSSVARVLSALKLPGIELTHIFNRNVARKRASDAARRVPASVVWTESFDDILHSNADIVVELMGGLVPAEAWLRKLLAAGKSVVTANKQLIAYRGAALSRLAAKHRVQLAYGAAVAGGVPVIPGILQGLCGDRVTRISGIVNGTCNYILSRMESGADYATVLADAQALGYAEADPSADVDGYDARAKLCILSRIALHAELDPDAVATQSISSVEAIDFAYAKELGCTIRQVSRAQVEGRVIHARVAPMLVPMTSPIAWSHGTQNMVVTSGRFGGDVVFSGHGAGGEPTAVAVVSDILAVAQR